MITEKQIEDVVTLAYILQNMIDTRNTVVAGLNTKPLFTSKDFLQDLYNRLTECCIKTSDEYQRIKNEMKELK